MLSPPVILPYRGYGTKDILYTKGHVLDDRVLYESSHTDRKRKNFKAMLSRYASSPIPDVRVEVKFKGYDLVVTTDDDGYFEAVFQFPKSLQISGWQKIRYKVLDKIVEDQEEMIVEDEVYILDEQAIYGVISDVDDTILISYATNILRKLRLILTKNSKTRLPFTGVAAFYKALHTGNRPGVNNPIFYVSSSEWNLYDFLEDFCEVRGIPKGPFLLKDLKTGLKEIFRSGGGSHVHKLRKIRHLFMTFKNLRFVLIGDSGQHDSLLYSQITREFPDRVISIYIRDVSSSRKDKKVNSIAKSLEDHEVDMLLVANTADAARHAYKNGLITKEELKHVILETIQERHKAESLIKQVFEQGGSGEKLSPDQL